MFSLPPPPTFFFFLAVFLFGTGTGLAKISWVRQVIPRRPPAPSSPTPLPSLAEGEGKTYPFYPSLCAKVISRFGGREGEERESEKVEVSVCKRLLNAYYSIQR